MNIFFSPSHLFPESVVCSVEEEALTSEEADTSPASSDATTERKL